VREPLAQWARPVYLVLLVHLELLVQLGLMEWLERLEQVVLRAVQERQALLVYRELQVSPDLADSLDSRDLLAVMAWLELLAQTDSRGRQVCLALQAGQVRLDTPALLVRVVLQAPLVCLDRRVVVDRVECREQPVCREHRAAPVDRVQVDRLVSRVPRERREQSDRQDLPVRPEVWDPLAEQVLLVRWELRDLLALQVLQVLLGRVG